MVGGLGFLVDVGLFSLLLLTALGHVPLIPRSMSVFAAIATNCAGNRWWADPDSRAAARRRAGLLRRVSLRAA
ncbi:MAG: hypothetical protein H7226_02395 [Salinibacterium sp.]|nr:hypothetical protein [Salinibacterium sp.]